MAMKSHLVAIGNSKGLRIPKAILELCHIKSEVDLTVEGGHIIISPPARKPREGWDEAYKKIHALGDDKLLIDDGLDLDFKDWEW